MGIFIILRTKIELIRMKYLSLIVLLIIYSCKQDKPKESVTSVKETGSGITQSITFNSDNDINLVLPEVGDSTVVKMIQQQLPHLNLIGQLFETERIYVMLGFIANDTGSPLIVTTDKTGKKLDSYLAYETAGGDMGYYSTNIVTINPDKTILFLDSTLTRQINETGTDEIPGTDSVFVKEKKYRITENGKIESMN